MMTNQQIVAAVQAAFSPLRCTAEVWDYGQMLRLQVFDANDKAIVTYPKQVLDAVRSVESLRAFLEMVRAQVQQRGHRLGPLKVL